MLNAKISWQRSYKYLEATLDKKFFFREHIDALKRFFDIAGSHPNALLRVVVDYEPPPSTHFIHRPRNVLNDPPDVLTAAVESLNDVNDTHD
ncbi:hypothetical protein EVAR_43578_1 [Eumeta japonica]|uniref:Uncharacterized protein n=1 Tax=Eumeta variegata TaxID=151549 RepID=A0A4C1XCM7_EUMVA|nr:hypothetical protein EVAR_43578_1 [Eumeta japonica]